MLQHKPTHTFQVIGGYQEEDYDQNNFPGAPNVNGSFGAAVTQMGEKDQTANPNLSKDAKATQQMGGNVSYMDELFGQPYTQLTTPRHVGKQELKL